MRKTVLLGAAGAIGNSIADALRKPGTPYRVVGRKPERLKASFGNDPLAEICAWNPDDPAAVRSALRNAGLVVYLVGVPYNQFQLHPDVMRKTLAGAIAEGVEQFLLIGTVYPYGRPTTPKVAETHPREPHTFKGKMRKTQEDLLLQAHNEGKLHGTVLRLPDFYGPGVETSFLDLLFKAAAKGGTADMVGPIDTPHEYLYVPDVGPVALALAAKPEAYGRWWNLAGPGSITSRQVAEQVFAMAGRKPKLRVVGKTMLRLIGLFQPIMKELVEMNYLMTTPVLLDDSALQELLGPLHKTSYADGLRSTFDYYRAH